MVAPDSDELVRRAQEGDEQAFAALVTPHRVAVFRHCYRMLGSGPDAEDAVQDSLLRAFRAIGSFEGRADFAGWLYRIATNVCLDRLRAARVRSHPVLLGPPVHSVRELTGPAEDAAWVEPVSDRDLGIGIDPLDATVAREAVSLAFVASLHRLAPRQRAALLLHDVLGFNQLEVAEVLATTPAAVNSLLFRARDAATTAPDRQPAPDDPRVQDLARRYLRAWERADLDAFVAVVTDDITFSMPPLPQWFSGRTDVADFVETAIFAPSRPYGITVRAGRCNGQLAVAIYEPAPDGTHRATGLQVLDIVGIDAPRVCGITSYRIAELVARGGLPDTVTPDTAP